jgi:6-hydroxycyclohex-1-ene-1-carbonyl-CoA dehydrogenase
VAGVVVAAGDAAAEWLGRRVVVPRVLPCGECDRCRRARTSSCRSPAPRGEVATCETVPARFLLSVEPALLPVDAPLWPLCALADAAAAPYAAMVRAGLSPGGLLLAVGGGVRGRFAARLAQAKGAMSAVLDADPARRAAAGSAGAGCVLDGADDDAEVLERLAAHARDRQSIAFELTVLETTGTAAGRRRAVELAALAGGTAVLLADGDGLEVTAPLDALAAAEAHVIGASACHPDLLPELLALVARGELSLDAEVERWPMSRLAEARAARLRGARLALPVLVPDDAPSY